MKSTKSLLNKGGIALIIGIYFILFTIFGIGLKCPFYEVTGLQCPGCGITHLVLCLLRGDIGGAFSYNPFVLVGGIYYVLLYAVYRGTSVYDKGCKLLCITCLLFGVLRIYTGLTA